MLNNLLIALLSGGTAAALAIAVFKMFSEKWLTTKFEERLATYRHEQQKELENLKFTISALFDRTVKLHQREFEMMPEAWGRLVDSYHHTFALVSPLQEYSDLDRMTTEHLNEFLKESPLMEWAKADVLAADNKTKIYGKYLAWHRLQNVQKIAREANIYLIKHGIFFPADLEERFEALNKLIWEALDEYEYNKQYADNGAFKHEKSKVLRSSGEQLLANLKTDLRGRLRAPSNHSLDRPAAQ